MREGVETHESDELSAVRAAIPDRFLQDGASLPAAVGAMVAELELGKIQTGRWELQAGSALEALPARFRDRGLVSGVRRLVDEWKSLQRAPRSGRRDFPGYSGYPFPG